MKTIDELLEGVARNLGVSPGPSVKAKAQKPAEKSLKECDSRQKQKKQPAIHAVQKTTLQQDIQSAIADTPHPIQEKKTACYDRLTLGFASEIAYCVEIGAKMMGICVCVSICSDKGNPILMHAMDGAYIVSPKASQDKAYTAAALKVPTHQALEMTKQGGTLEGLTNGDGILLLGGGYPLEDCGSIFGGVGVSGGTKEQDAALAQLGLVYFRTRRAVGK